MARARPVSAQYWHTLALLEGLPVCRIGVRRRRRPADPGGARGAGDPAPGALPAVPCAALLDRPAGALRQFRLSRPHVGALRHVGVAVGVSGARLCTRSEEHTSELQSIMRISYAVFCLNKKMQ